MREGRRHKRITAPAAERLEARQLLSTSMRAVPANVGLSASPAFSQGTNGPFGLSPANIRAAYGIDNVRFNGVVGDGSGQTIAIVVAYDNPSFVSSTSANFATSDLHLFDQQFGIADPPSFTKVSQTGSATALPGTDPTGSWENETALDVEWAHVAAPAANIVLVECNSDGLDDLIKGGVQYARQLAGVSVVSMSFAAPEAANETTYDQYLTTPAGHKGVTFVAASGDNGGTAEYPAASPTVIGVGGTTTYLAGDIYSDETALSNGGGGVSLYEPKPAFQAALTQSATHRMVPDVSFAANHFTNGFDVYDSYNGGSAANAWYSVGGTSVSAPIWAGLVAQANQGRARLGLATLDAASSTMPRIYYLSQSDFHDITTGSNGNAAGTGYDLATGRGTPIANLLVPDLAGGANLAGNVYVDANVNGTRDTGEAGLAGALVYLDLAQNGVVGGIDPVVYTAGSAGAFAINDLPGGTYRLSALPYTSYAPTTASYITVTIGYNTTVSGKLFGQRHVTGTISGHVFEDQNLNQVRGTSEPIYAGWSVFLDNNNNGVYDAGDVKTTTNSSGVYQFSGLGLGVVYHVYQDIPVGYSRTTLAGGTAAAVTLLDTAFILDIGYVPNTASLSGIVFRDDNGNKTRDGSEPVLPNVTVYLDLNRDGSYTPGVDVRVVTSSTGAYSVIGMAPGTYLVNEVIPAGYRRTGNATAATSVVVGVAAAVTNVNFADQLT